MILSAFFLGFLGIFVKLIDPSYNIFMLNFYRIFFATVFLAIIVPFLDKNTFKIPNKSDLKNYALIGLIFSIATSLTNIAYKLAPVSNVALITALSPFFILIFAFFILKEEITKTKIITLIIALVGLFFINPLRTEGFLGNIFAFLVAILHGLLVVLMRKQDINHGISDVFWFFVFASLFLTPTLFFTGLDKINLYIVLIGLVPTALTYLFYNLALKRIEAEIASIINRIITPLTSIVFAVLIFSEKLLPEVILGGCILIIAGIYLNLHLKK